MTLAKYEEPKNLTVPLKACPEVALNEQVAFLSNWLEMVLSVKSEVVENQKRIMILLPLIKETAWSLSVKQIQDAFLLYIDGKLSYEGKFLEPISGYLDAILFKKVISAYKSNKSPVQDRKSTCISIQDYYRKNKGLRTDIVNPIKGVSECFDYLYDKGLLPKRNQDENVEARYSKLMEAAQGYLYIPLWEKSKWFEDEGLKDVPKYKELQSEMSELKSGNHKSVLPLFKALVLEGYFNKLKTNLKDIL